MTIKEFFEIEPIQKNSLIVFLFVFFISFLQLYLFKTDFAKETDFLKIVLSISISVCWIIAEIPSYIFAVPVLIDKDQDFFENKLIELLIISLGFSLLFWMVTATYVGYELNLEMKDFIRLSIISMFLKALYWFIRNKIHAKKISQQTK